MTIDRVKEHWGVDFSIVPEGLAEDQVVNYVNDLVARTQNGREEQDHNSPLFKLAEQTVIEAHKIAESTKEQAIQEAEAEAAKIRMDAEEAALEQARQVLDTTQNEAAAKASTIIGKAEQEAEQVLRSAQREANDILQAAKQTADDVQSQAKLEAEFTIRKLQARLTEEIRSGVTKICNSLLPSSGSSTNGSDNMEDVRDSGEATKPIPVSTQVKKRASAKK